MTRRSLRFARVQRDAFILFLALFIAVSGVFAPAAAQLPGQGAAQPQEIQEAPADPYGRTSPSRLVERLIETLAAEDYALATNYLDLSEIPKSQRAARGADLARDLEILLDRGGSVLPPLQLSNQPEGHTNDGLEIGYDRIGALQAGDVAAPLLAERIETETGYAWVVSSRTLAEVPALMENVSTAYIDDVLPAVLVQTHAFGAPIGHWVALVGLGVGCFFGARLAVALILSPLRLALRGPRRDIVRRIILATATPISLLIAAWGFVLVTQMLGLSIVARAFTLRLVDIIFVFAAAFFIWRLIDVFTRAGADRWAHRGRLEVVSATNFLRRTLKAIVAILAAVSILSVLGVNVSTGLTALGIGGLAIALGAQKTVENIVGGISVIADSPVRVGDFCRAGDVLGTVEDIGLRSTRIRTLARTVVTIPNGEFSSMKIENYASRDRMLYNPVLTMRYETTPEQIRYLLVEIRKMLYAHPRVDHDPARIRFLGFGSDSLRLEVFAYVLTKTYDEFLEIQEDLNLRIMDIVEKSGSAFAFPSQTVYLAKDKMPPEEKVREAESAVAKWREGEELQIPRFDPERIQSLAGSIDYPPKGSALRRSMEQEQPSLFEGDVSKKRRRRNFFRFDADPDRK